MAFGKGELPYAADYVQHFVEQGPVERVSRKFKKKRLDSKDSYYDEGSWWFRSARDRAPITDDLFNLVWDYGTTGSVKVHFNLHITSLETGTEIYKSNAREEAVIKNTTYVLDELREDTAELHRISLLLKPGNYSMVLRHHDSQWLNHYSVTQKLNMIQNQTNIAAGDSIRYWEQDFSALLPEHTTEMTYVNAATGRMGTENFEGGS